MAADRALEARCRAAGIPYFRKQLGARPYQPGDGVKTLDTGYPIRDRAGADPAEWPAALRVREFPTPT